MQSHLQEQQTYENKLQRKTMHRKVKREGKNNFKLVVMSRGIARVKIR